MNLTDLRQYAIIPANGPEAQEVADWLVSKGESVNADYIRGFFRKFPIIAFDHNDWCQFREDASKLSDRPRITAQDFLAKFRDNQMSELEYWKERCILAEAMEAASPCDRDINKKQIAAHEAYNNFIRNNPEP